MANRGWIAWDWDAEHLLLAISPTTHGAMPGCWTLTLTSDPRTGMCRVCACPGSERLGYRLRWLFVAGCDGDAVAGCGAVTALAVPMFTVLCARPPESSGAVLTGKLVCGMPNAEQVSRETRP